MLLCLLLWGGLLFHVMRQPAKRSVGNVIILVAGCLLTLLALPGLSLNYQVDLLTKEVWLAAIYAYYQNTHSEPFLRYCHIRKIPFRKWWLIPVFTLLMIWISQYVNSISMLFFSNMITDILEEGNNHLPGMIVDVAVGSAIVEECLFRGCVYRSIRNKKRAIVFTALLFALFHMNFNQMSYAFVMGLLFALVVNYTDNLTFTIWIHMLFNMYSLLETAMKDVPWFRQILHIHVGSYYLFGPSMQYTSGEIAWINIAMGFLVAAASLCVVILLLKWFGHQETQERKGEEEKENLDWTPNAWFVVGCALCLLVALLLEVAGS
jgi:membrane protease YdiL (CAAX protease family)